MTAKDNGSIVTVGNIYNMNKIDPNKWYSLTEIVQLGFFPWAKTIKGVRRWVNIDKKGRNKMKATIVGEGNLKRYHIKGKSIIEFLACVEDGTYSR